MPELLPYAPGSPEWLAARSTANIANGDMSGLSARVLSLADLPADWQDQLANELTDMAATTRRLNQLAARRSSSGSDTHPRAGRAVDGRAGAAAGETRTQTDPRAARAASPRGARLSQRRPDHA